MPQENEIVPSALAVKVAERIAREVYSTHPGSTIAERIIDEETRFQGLTSEEWAKEADLNEQAAERWKHSQEEWKVRAEQAESLLAKAEEDAERWRALQTTKFLRHPCELPLSDGGWHAAMEGDWGKCGVFADDLTELADRIILHNIEVSSRPPLPAGETGKKDGKV